MEDFMKRFMNGSAWDAYDYFGVHEARINGTNGYIFRVYAPNAARVQLMGDFSHWIKFDMNRDKYGIFSAFCADAVEGQLYKYVITDRHGKETEKADPYAFKSEKPPACASVIYSPDRFRFTDSEWIKKRSDYYNKPMNIYEIHFGSWKVKSWEEGKLPEHYSYSELIPKLIPYLRENGYTHVELMPICEHPFYGSWGYQCSGFFSPTARYGDPDGLMRFIDICHRNGIGVFLDFVPVHFAADEMFLHMFDGTPLYEYDSPDMMYNNWGSCNFCHSKPWVSSFLNSAADFWISKYHVDGLRLDAISNMIYVQGDSRRGVNGGAVNFLKTLNSGVHMRYTNVLMMAEDSTDFLKVTAPVEYDGLGFDYKWDMGWMNDTLNFFKTPPNERVDHYYKFKFSMEYFYNELFLLSLSHDEVVHGKATIMQKMWGDYDQKFPQCRLLFLYMYTHPGKKLNFMGNEFGQLREWDECREQDWNMLSYPLHDSLHRLVRDLSLVYLSHSALYDGEYNSSCFRWLEGDDALGGVYAYQRTSGSKSVVVVLNTSDKAYDNYAVGCFGKLKLREIINSDNFIYSGGGMVNSEPVTAAKQPCKGKPYNFIVKLAPFSGAIFEAEESRSSKASNKGAV